MRTLCYPKDSLIISIFPELKHHLLPYYMSNFSVRNVSALMGSDFFTFRKVPNLQMIDGKALYHFPIFILEILSSQKLIAQLSLGLA